jgi:predicted SAM-dependent methyltransferase
MLKSTTFGDRYDSIYKKLRTQKHYLATELSIVSGKIKRILIPVQPPKLANGEINLHLGCGSINHPKFLNIDGLPSQHIHHVGPIDDLSKFQTDSVNLIYACHCLEHFPHRQVPKVLAEWFRTLKKGGILRLSVPNFDLLLEIYYDNGKDISTIVPVLMGNQDYKYNFHMTAFNKANLTSLLEKAGFECVEEWQPGSCELTTFDDHSNSKHEVNGKQYPVSLNLQAIK